MNLPNGAKEIVAARKRGMKPAGMLIISLVGPVAESNHIIHANPSAEYDWRWVVGLDACIYARQGVKWKGMAFEIAKANPHWLALWDVDRFMGCDLHAIYKVEDLHKPMDKWGQRLACMRWPKFENEIYAWSDE